MARTKTTKNRTKTGRGPRGMRQALELRGAAWLARHPGFAATPAALGTSVAEFGPVTTGAVAAGMAASSLGWARWAPDSFQRFAAPTARAFGHRWSRYIGTRWRATLEACDLTREDRRTGQALVPRIVRVSSPTPSIDILTVKCVKGQSVRIWRDHQDELADTLGADAISIEKHKPGQVRITLVRGNPFATVIPPADIPDEPGEVDLTAIPLGETEYGQTWTEPLIGNFWLVHGRAGSGKSGLLWNPLRAVGPMIRDGLVRPWVIDPKGGMETKAGKPLFHKHCTTVSADDEDDELVFDDDEDDTGTDGPAPVETALDVVRAFRDHMKARQRDLEAAGQRKFTVSQDTPLEVLIIDELAMLTALGDRRAVSELNRLLAEVLTQGRAPGFAVLAYVQEPTKDVVPIRDLFTVRICLGTTSANYVNATLGEDAREKGALADEIPPGEEYAGIGYRMGETSRMPTRVRAGEVRDDDITELVRTCTPSTTHDDRADDGNVIHLAA